MRERLRSFRGVVDDDAGSPSGAGKQTGTAAAAAAPAKDDSVTALVQRGNNASVARNVESINNSISVSMTKATAAAAAFLSGPAIHPAGGL